MRALREAIGSCDAVLTASPEYAHGVTGTLKNALHWLVSFEGFVGKRVAIFNASPPSVHADASLALPLRSTGVTEQGIVDSELASRIRAALPVLLGNRS